MARRVSFSIPGQRDLGAVTRWYQQSGSGISAKTRLQRIKSAVAGLALNPCSYREGVIEGTRELICERHRILFRVEPDTGDNVTAGNVEILRILGPGQLIP